MSSYPSTSGAMMPQTSLAHAPSVPATQSDAILRLFSDLLTACSPPPQSAPGAQGLETTLAASTQSFPALLDTFGLTRLPSTDALAFLPPAQITAHTSTKPRPFPKRRIPKKNLRLLILVRMLLKELGGGRRLRSEDACKVIGSRVQSATSERRSAMQSTWRSD